MRKLLDAAMRVFAERGFHASRVDDIVRAARTSHGTFYLYFANKEDLLRTLAVECAGEWEAMAGQLGAVTPDAAGRAELRAFLDNGRTGLHHRTALETLQIGQRIKPPAFVDELLGSVQRKSFIAVSGQGPSREPVFQAGGPPCRESE